MVLFEYEYRDTLMHRMNPLTKITVITCLSVLSTLYWDLRFLLPIFVISVLMAWDAKLPKSWVKLLLVLSLLGIWTRLLQSIFMVNPEFFKVLPPELVNKTLVEITPEGTPIIGRTAITYGSLYYLAPIILRIPISVCLGLTLIYTTSLGDIVQVLRMLRVPERLIFIVMAAWRFLPLMIRNIENVAKAQSLRGWKIESRNPSKLLKQIHPLTRPIARHFVATIDAVALSVELRGFGVGKPSPLKKLEFTALDYATVIILPPLTVLLWYLAIVYHIGLI